MNEFFFGHNSYSLISVIKIEYYIFLHELLLQRYTFSHEYSTLYYIFLHEHPKFP